MQELIIESLKELNKDLELKEFENITSNTPIFEVLDSVAVLDLILDLEERLQKKYNRYIQIADDKTMDAQNTPFKNVETLSKYLKELI